MKFLSLHSSNGMHGNNPELSILSVEIKIFKLLEITAVQPQSNNAKDEGYFN